MKLKRGNYDENEYTVGLSTLGIDLAAEGPLNRKEGSYIANYRYSSLDLLDRAGVFDFGGAPRYQDLTYNIYLPLNRRHFLSVFGLGGISSISTVDEDDDTEENLRRNTFDATMGTAGLIHNFLITDNSYLKSFASFSRTTLESETDLPTASDNEQYYNVFNGDITKIYFRTGSTYGHKLNARNKVEVGFIYNHIGYKMAQNAWNYERDQIENELSDEGSTDRIQAFATWKFRISQDLTMTSGAHFNGLTLNDSYSFEPRLAFGWDFTEGKALSLGGGLHSKMESPAVYLWKFEDENGSIIQPNKDLKMSKAAHLVLGYDQQLGPHTHLKSEIYYQHLYDSPVEDDPNSTYSLLNEVEQFTPRRLVNDGQGRNYGVELTLERYLHKGFYYLTSASIFRSLYTPKDGIERETAYASDYIFNFLGGKEFSIGRAEKNRVLFINTKISVLGGRRYTPIDLEASIATGEEILQEDRPFSVKSDDLFIPNLAIGIRRNRPKSTHEFKIDIQNVTNNSAVVQEYYIQQTEEIEELPQLGIVPTISYTINF